MNDALLLLLGIYQPVNKYPAIINDLMSAKGINLCTCQYFTLFTMMSFSLTYIQICLVLLNYLHMKS